MGFIQTSAAIERTIADRQTGADRLRKEVADDKTRLPGLMDDGAAYERAFNQVAAKESRLNAMVASLAPLESELTAARERETKAHDQAALADFERRKRKAAPRRQALYNRLATDIAALTLEMRAESDEAEALRRRGFHAQPAISHAVVRYLHLPKWDEPGEIYCPRGVDGYALHQAFLGRRAR